MQWLSMENFLMITRLLTVSALLAFIACAPGSGQRSEPPTPIPARAHGSHLDEYLRRAEAFGFSGAYLIVRDGETLLHDGYGLADRENGVRMTAETVFDIGSITKQFTAAAILKLAEQGRLRVTDSIGRFLNDVPADKRGITIHHLLTHTSGLEGDLGGDYQVMPRDSMISGALRSELQWAPGTRFDYSNLGYSVLGAIIELASGQPYERYLHDHLLAPAGMRKTGYRIPAWSAGELAVGYREGRRWGTPLDHAWAQDGPWWNLRANGGILSTMGDLYRWHQALEGDQMLSSASKTLLFTPHVATDGEGRFHYAYGWGVVRTPRDTRLITHNGGNGYFFADFLRFVDEDVVIILATNDASQQIRPVVTRVTAAVFSDRTPRLPPAPAAQLSAQELERYAGSYLLPSGARIVVSRSGHLLQADAAGQAATELLAGTDPQLVEGQRRLSARADSIIAAAARGDFAPLQAASPNPQRSRETLQRIWSTAEQNHGAFRHHEVLGTLATWWGEEIEPTTFIRLHFERGSRLFRFHWDDDRISGFGGMAIPSPAPTTLIPQGGSRFVGYNLGIEYEVPIAFETGANGAITAMVLTTPAGDVRAARSAD